MDTIHSKFQCEKVHNTPDHEYQYTPLENLHVSSQLINQSTLNYESFTLHEYNHERQNFLPCFPPLSRNVPPTLIFSNVPVKRLSDYQLERRRPGVFKCPFNFIENQKSKMSSFMIFLYRNLIIDMSQKFKIDPSIIDYNLTLLDECITMVVNKRAQQFPNEKQYSHQCKFFRIQDWQMALEFFLQFDADIFFLKTCTYKNCHPRTVGSVPDGPTEGLFCIDEPEARYLMMSCEQSDCPCCHQLIDLTNRPKPSVQLPSQGVHRFVNGYLAYMNCHATCKSSNFIYVLTCPCGNFDYIGETQSGFREIFIYYRRQSCRVIHEALLGSSIVQLSLDIRERQKTVEEEAINNMRLFQHITQCPIAIQMFLNCTTVYWCFVPMTLDEANIDDAHSTKINKSSLEEMWPGNIRSDDETQAFLNNIPLPPIGYRFSLRQQQEQWAFFKQFYDEVLPNRHLDIFDMAIVALMPNNCHVLLRRMVESLFITHAECKLNTTGHLVDCPPIYNHEHGKWYEYIIRHPIPS